MFATANQDKSQQNGCDCQGHLIFLPVHLKVAMIKLYDYVQNETGLIQQAPLHRKLKTLMLESDMPLLPTETLPLSLRNFLFLQGFLVKQKLQKQICHISFYKLKKKNISKVHLVKTKWSGAFP